MTRLLLKISTALALLSAPTMAAANDTLDVVAQFEIQAPKPSTSGYIFTRMGIAETLVNADANGNLTPGRYCRKLFGFWLDLLWCRGSLRTGSAVGAER